MASSFPGDRVGPNIQNIYKEDLGSEQPSSVTGTAAWQVKPLPAMLVSHMGVQVRIPAAPLTIQLSVNGPGKATKDSPSTWTTAPTWESQKKLLAPI